MKIVIWCESAITQRPAMRPSMLYHVISIYLTLYLFVIKKVTFISHFGALNGRMKRNSKNHRFLEFRLIFRASSHSRRCSKQLKIVPESFYKLKFISLGPKAIIFYSGQYSHLIFQNFVTHIMAGRMAGRHSLSLDQGFNYKNHVFLATKCSIGLLSAPLSPLHVHQNSPRHSPLHTLLLDRPSCRFFTKYRYITQLHEPSKGLRPSMRPSMFHN